VTLLVLRMRRVSLMRRMAFLALLVGGVPPAMRGVRLLGGVGGV
jgi:hypothetical protein